MRRPAAEIKRTALSPRAVDPVDVLVGRNIRLQRIAKGISQTELGRRIGVTFQQVQKYEAGANRITSARLARLAEVFGVPLAALFDGVKGVPGEADGSPLHLTADPRSFRLALAHAQIDDASLSRALVALVEHLARLCRSRRDGEPA